MFRLILSLLALLGTPDYGTAWRVARVRYNLIQESLRLENNADPLNPIAGGKP